MSQDAGEQVNIVDAIKSGMPRRFPNSQSIVNQDWHTSGLYDSNDVLTECWEIQEPTVTITRTQLLSALDGVLTVGGAKLVAFEGRNIAEQIANKLGLGDPK